MGDREHENEAQADLAVEAFQKVRRAIQAAALALPEVRTDDGLTARLSADQRIRREGEAREAAILAISDLAKALGLVPDVAEVARDQVSAFAARLASELGARGHSNVARAVVVADRRAPTPPPAKCAHESDLADVLAKLDNVSNELGQRCAEVGQLRAQVAGRDERIHKVEAALLEQLHERTKADNLIAVLEHQMKKLSESLGHASEREKSDAVRIANLQAHVREATADVQSANRNTADRDRKHHEARRIELEGRDQVERDLTAEIERKNGLLRSVCDGLAEAIHSWVEWTRRGSAAGGDDQRLRDERTRIAELRSLLVARPDGPAPAASPTPAHIGPSAVPLDRWRAWANYHDSHGRILGDLIWLPADTLPDKPEYGTWVRVPWMDSAPGEVP